MRKTRDLLAAGLFTLSVALCATQPAQFNFQAKLSQSNGAPLTGNHSCLFRIYEGGSAGSANSGTLKYEESSSLNFQDGVVNHTVGTGTPSGPSLSAGPFATSAELYLQVAVDGTTILPRTKLVSVPFAITAAFAANGEVRSIIDPSAAGFSTPVVISAPGSYYLAGNINVTNSSDAIQITTECVSLDLNGFTISSNANPSTGTAILIDSAGSGYVIRNGNIKSSAVVVGSNPVTAVSGPGFKDGIAQAGFDTLGVRVSDISISGLSHNAISFEGPSPLALVENCTVRLVGGVGINAGRISRCSVDQSYISSIDGQIVSDCYANSFSGLGISAQTVTNCQANAINGAAISAFTATNCTASSTNNYGIVTDTALNCSGSSTNATGLYVNHTAMNCYGHSSHDIGLRAEITINCSGDSPAADGLVAIFAATNCYGHSSGNTSTGLNVNGTANACGGGNDNGGFAIKAAIGIGCGNFGGTTSITNKYLAP